MSQYLITPAWRLDDARLEHDARDFWNRLRILPAGVDPAARAKELVAIARRGSEVVGVATASPEEIGFLRSRFAMFRCAVSPEHRRSHVAFELTVYSRPLLERWSFENPGELVQGMALVVQADLGEKARQPLWTASGLTLVGFTPQGQQVRVAWFKHARV